MRQKLLGRGRDRSVVQCESLRDSAAEGRKSRVTASRLASAQCNVADRSSTLVRFHKPPVSSRTRSQKMAQGVGVRGEKILGPKVLGKKSGVPGSRRIFPAAFKIMVLDSYRSDKDCIGNQRATARKYGIHRRQIQKWLQCEQDLRNSCVAGPKVPALNLSLRPEEPPSSSAITGRVGGSFAPGVFSRSLENDRVSPDSTSKEPEARKETKFCSIRDLIGSNSDDEKSSGRPLELENNNIVSTSNYVCSSGNGVDSPPDFNRFDLQKTENFIPNAGICNGIGPHPDFARFSPKPPENSISNRIRSISNGVRPSHDFQTFLPEAQDNSTCNGRKSIISGIGPPSDRLEFPGKPSENSIATSSITNGIGSIINKIGPISNGTESPPQTPENLIDISSANGIGSINNGFGTIGSRISSSPDFSRFSPKTPENLSDNSISNGNAGEFNRKPIRARIIDAGPLIHYAPIDFNCNLIGPEAPGNSVGKIMDLEEKGGLKIGSDFDSTSESGSPAPSDSDDPLDCSMEFPEQVTRRRSFPLAFKLQVLDNFHNTDENQRATARRFRINRRQVQKWLAQETELRQEVKLRQGQARQRLTAAEQPAPVDLRTYGFQDRPLCLVVPKSELPKPKKDYITFKPYLDNPVVKPDEQRNDCYCFLPQWRYETTSTFFRYPVRYM